MKRIALSIIIALIMVLGASIPMFAATTADVTVTAAPAFIGISIAQSTWTINGIDGSGLITKNTVYYSNATGATGDITAPNNPVVNGDCYFIIANTSTIVTDITVNFPDFASGDAMTNIDTGYANNGANAFGASGYITGMAWPGDVVILKHTGSDALKTSLAAITNLYFGIAIKTKSGDFASGTAMTSTVVATATAH